MLFCCKLQRFSSLYKSIFSKNSWHDYFFVSFFFFTSKNGRKSPFLDVIRLSEVCLHLRLCFLLRFMSASCINFSKTVEPWAMAPEFYDNPIGVPGEFTPDVNQILQHRTQSAPRYFKFYRHQFFAFQCLLADIAQTVVG